MTVKKIEPHFERDYPQNSIFLFIRGKVQKITLFWEKQDKCAIILFLYRLRIVVLCVTLFVHVDYSVCVL